MVICHVIHSSTTKSSWTYHCLVNDLATLIFVSKGVKNIYLSTATVYGVTPPMIFINHGTKIYNKKKSYISPTCLIFNKLLDIGDTNLQIRHEEYVPDDRAFVMGRMIHNLCTPKHAFLVLCCFLSLFVSWCLQ